MIQKNCSQICTVFNADVAHQTSQVVPKYFSNATVRYVWHFLSKNKIKFLHVEYTAAHYLATPQS